MIDKNNSKNNSGNRNIKSTQFKVAFITQAAVIAALYVVLVIMFNYCSFGPIQFRIAEALTILPYFTPAAIPGLFVGCLLSNILGGAAKHMDFEKEKWIEVVKKTVPTKTVDVNVKAFLAGYEMG